MDGTKAGTSTTLEHPGSLWSKIRMARSSITPPLKLNDSTLCSSFLKAVNRPGFIEQTKGVRCAMPGVENRLFAKISMLGRCCIMLLILPCCLDIENMDGTKAGTSTTLEHPGSLWSKIRMARSSITPPLKLNDSTLCSSFLKAVNRPGFPYVQLGVAACANEKEKAVQSCLGAQISWKSSWPVAAWVEDFEQMGFGVTANTTPVHHSRLQIEVVVSDPAARYQSGKLLKRCEWSVCMVNFDTGILVKTLRCQGKD